MTRVCRLTFLLVVAAVLVWPGPVPALPRGMQVEGAGAAPAPAHGPAPKGDDSPFAGETHQILDLAIWTVVVFLILLFVLSKFAWKPMLQGLQKREQDIHSAIEEAHKTREEARRLHE